MERLPAARAASSGFSSSSTSSSSSYLSSSQFHHEVFSVCSECSSSHARSEGYAPSPRLSPSHAFCLLLRRKRRAFARPPVRRCESYRALRAVIYAPCCTCIPTTHTGTHRCCTRCINITGCNPEIRKSGNTGSMKPRASHPLILGKARRCKTPQDPWILLKLTMPTIIIRIELRSNAKLRYQSMENFKYISRISFPNKNISRIFYSYIIASFWLFFGSEIIFL